MNDQPPSIESELRRLREKNNCSVVIENRHEFYDFRKSPVQDFWVCLFLPAEEVIMSRRPTLEEAVSEVELKFLKQSPEAKAEKLRKNAAELLKQAEELSPLKHEPAS